MLPALHNAWSPIIAGLFAGNAVVLKCSEQVVWSTNWFVGIINSCLEACGHNPDLVQVVCCYPEEAGALTKSPRIKHITFIGSETVGRKVCSLCKFIALSCSHLSDRSRRYDPFDSGDFGTWWQRPCRHSSRDRLAEVR